MLTLLPIPMTLAVLLALTPTLGGSAPPVPENYEQFQATLTSILALADESDRYSVLDEWWPELQQAGRLPFVDGEHVAFLLRAPQAGTVAVAGDFNGWDPQQGNASRIVGTDLWIFEADFPLDARLDYKFVLDGGRWILDPANPHRQRGGFGDNSELRMPDYVPSPWVVRQPDVPRGRLTPATIESKALGYAVDYRVYSPPGYDELSELSDLPVLYVTDGHEYADDTMGSAVIVLDNLIAAGRLRPILAVFIDPRGGGRNLRGEQYVLNQEFVDFVARELVPVIDGAWRTSPRREDRGILGTSLGGLNSAWFGYRAPETFYHIGIQSPAFQAGDGRILDLYRESPRLDLDIYMTWGTMHDFGEHTLEFRRILDEKGYEYRHLILPEGHSWGAWRALLDDILPAFWPAD